jgi:hypothetical protein
MRISKFGAAAVAATLTFGGAALAFADDAMPADPTVDPGATTTTVAGGDQATTTTTAVEVPETTTTIAGGDQGDDVEPPEAPEGPEDDQGEDSGATHEHPDNHGKAVSEAAHNTPPGPGHGKAVSQVAHQNHGQSKGDEGDSGSDSSED